MNPLAASMPYFKRILVLGLVAIVMAGCGDRPSDLIGEEEEDMDDDMTPTGAAATCTVISVNGTSGDITINFSTADADGDTVTVFISFSTDTGATFTQCAPAAANVFPNGGSGLFTSSMSTFIWDSALDAGTSMITVRIRIAVADSNHPAGSCNSMDIVLNSGSAATPPSCAITAPAAGATLGGNIPIAYTLTDDDNATTADITAQYSTDMGTTFLTATLVAGSTEGVTGLSTSTSGAPHTFRWDSRTDLPGQDTAAITGVLFRITPRDDDGTGGSCTSGAITIDGAAPANTQPSCAITAPAAAAMLTGDVTLSYTLTDAEQTTGGIVVSYSTDAGATYQTATESSAAASEGISGLTMSAAGSAHTYVWDSLTDVPGQATMMLSMVRLRIVASDGTLTGTPCETMNFTLAAPRMLATAGVAARSAPGAAVFNEIACCGATSNPLLLTSVIASLQLLVEATFTQAPITENVSMATSTSGTTTYAVSDTTVVTASADGLVSAVATGANRCTAITITFTPNGTTAFGAPQMRVIAACVDIGGSTIANRLGIDGMAGTADDVLAVGDVDVTFPASASAIPVGAGGTFDLDFFVNAGTTSLGAFAFDIMFTNTVVNIDTTMGDMGVSESTTHPGFTNLVNPENPLGRLRISGFSVDTTNTGVFELLTVHAVRVTAGMSSWDLMITDLASTPGATPIGAATPRAAIAGTGTINIP